MKFSTAMLKGYEMVGGKQYRGNYCAPYDSYTEPTRVCVLGAANLGEHGIVTGMRAWLWDDAFGEKWGVCATDLNDGGMPWEHIYGMAKAVGL